MTKHEKGKNLRIEPSGLPSTSSPRERLDVPAISPLEKKLLVNPPTKPNMQPLPPSGVLDRLKAFLPQMAAANQVLEKRLEQGANMNEFDIENVDEFSEKPYIEMDLACGLIELKDPAMLPVAEQALQALQDQQAVAQEASSSDSDSDSNEDDMEEEGGEGQPELIGQHSMGSHSSRRQNAAAEKELAASADVEMLDAPSHSLTGKRGMKQKRKAKIQEL